MVHSFKGVDMSQGGEVTTQKVVYGPDGKAYGNPALARAAGVNQTYREDGTPYPETMLGNLPLSPSVPITEAFDPSAGIGEFERRQFLPNQPVPVPSQYQQVMGQTGGATPYERIMARMTPTMNPYGSVSGGYDPSFQGGYDPGLYSRLTRSGLINTGGMGGGGGGGDYTPTPSPFDNMTDAEKAAFYAANPTMATITQLGQKAFGLTSLGALQRAMNPGFVSDQSLIAMGVNPAAYQAAKESFRASEIADMNAAAEAAQAEAGRQAAQESFRASEIAQQNNPTTTPDSPGGGDFGGSGYDGGMFGGAQSGDVGFAMGGLVDRVGGPNPAGPDDGAGMLQLGEYVIKKSAVNKYGQGLLDMINDGKIPAKKMKSLLG